MFRLITRGIRAIANVAKKIVQKIKDNSRNAEIRDRDRTPEKRTFTVKSERDSITCGLCLGKDGTRFTVTSSDSVLKIADRMRQNTPPFHTNCRCKLEPS